MGKKRRSILIEAFVGSIIVVGVVLLLNSIHDANQNYERALRYAEAAGIAIKDDQIPAGRLAGLSSRSPSSRPYIQAAFAATKISNQFMGGKKFQFDLPSKIPLAQRQEIVSKFVNIDTLIAEGNRMPTDERNIQGPMAERQQFFTLGSIQYIANVLAFQIDTEAKLGQFDRAGKHLTSLFGIAANVGLGGSYSLQTFSTIVAKIGLDQTLNCLNLANGNPKYLKPIFDALSHFPTPNLSKLCKYEWINNANVFSHAEPIHMTPSAVDNSESVTPWEMNFDWLRKQWATEYLFELSNLQISLQQSPPAWPLVYNHVQWVTRAGATPPLQPYTAMRQQIGQNLWRTFSGDITNEAFYQLTVAIAAELADETKTPLPSRIDLDENFDPISGDSLNVKVSKTEISVKTTSSDYMTQGDSGPIVGSLTLKISKPR